MRTERRAAKHSLRSMVRIALFAAVIAVLSQFFILLPMGIPLTLQVFAVALCGFVLGGREGASAVAVYVLLGAVGLPVFHGFSGGFSALFGVTGGFLFGFIPFSLLAGVGSRRRRPYGTLLCGALGLLFCHVCGILYYTCFAGVSLTHAFFAVSLPFLWKDLLLTVAAYVVSLPLKRAIARIDR